MRHNNLTKEQQDQADQAFRDYCKIYFSEESSEEEVDNAWQKMFDLVLKASEAVVKTKLKNIRIDDDLLEEHILDTASDVMKSLRKKKLNGKTFVLKNRLVSLCGPYALWPLYNKQQVFEDNMLSLNGYVEDNGEACLGFTE